MSIEQDELKWNENVISENSLNRLKTEFKTKMEETKDTNPLYQGYGDLMEPGFHVNDAPMDLNNFECKYQSIDLEKDDAKITHNFSQDLVEYKEHAD